MKVNIETSARHIHVSREHLDILYGKDYELNYKRELSQPGQYLCDERVGLYGPKGSFPSVAILGPTRPSTQVEITHTDARALGVTVPVRESGDVKGSAGLKITGPKGEIELSEGTIAAKRHIHITPEDAAALGVSDKQIVKVKISGDRALVFDEVVVRISPEFRTSMHIDIDEANAANIAGGGEGEIIV